VQPIHEFESGGMLLRSCDSDCGLGRLLSSSAFQFSFGDNDSFETSLFG
jgi:hypothetical protein